MMTVTTSDQDTIRLYYYTAKTWGLKSLWERRLKLARYGELNDPFELFPFDRTNKRSRTFWEQAVQAIVQGDHGIVCLSSTWQNPQMWTQYADKHSGICLGFDVLRAFAEPVHYTDTLLPDPFEHRKALQRLPAEVIEAALRYKHAGWRHEREWRVRAPLTHGQDGVFYLPFDRGIELREVILGPRCSLAPGEVVHAIESPPLDVEIFSTRASYDAFHIERHELVSTHDIRGFRAALSESPDAYWDFSDDHADAPGSSPGKKPA